MDGEAVRLATVLFPMLNLDFDCEYHNRIRVDPSKQTCVIVIGCYNHFHLTRSLVDQLAATLDRRYNYLVYFFDDASEEPDTRLFFEAQVSDLPFPVRFFRYATNRKLTWTWNFAVNYGLFRDRADYFIFLNNDTTLMPGWAGTLVDFAAGLKGRCAVGPLSNCVSRHGKQDVANYLPDLTPAQRRDHTCVLPRLSDHSPVRIPKDDFLNGCCFLLPAKALRRHVFRRTADFTFFFNPAYPFYFSELEFFSRFRYPKFVLPAVFIHHEGEVTVRSYRSSFRELYVDGSTAVDTGLLDRLMPCIWSRDKRAWLRIRREESRLRNYLADTGKDHFWDLYRRQYVGVSTDARILYRQRKLLPAG